MRLTKSNKKLPAPVKFEPFRRKRTKCPIPRSTFTSYMDEGFMHYRAGHFEKALNCYDRALEIKSTHKGALVARSQCHMRMGEAQAALDDAEATMDKNGEKTSCLGLYQFGDALYNLGFFEKSLIVFTRGRRWRRDMDVFRIGIQKAQNAIRTAIGDKACTQMEDLELILPQLKKELSNAGATPIPHCCIRPDDDKPYNRHIKQKKVNMHRLRWVSREVLGEMYADKEYFTKFLHRPDIQKDVGYTHKLKKSASEALKFLKVREKFLHQVCPMYARKRGLNYNFNMVLSFEGQERERREAVRKVKMEAAEGSVMKNIGLIEHDLSIGRPNDCRLQCDRAIRQLEKVSVIMCPRKPEFLCKIYQYKGLALLRMKKYDKCVEVFQAEFNMAEANNLPLYKKQAHDYLGRSYAYKRDFLEASEIWESQISTARSSLERAYLFHEIGRCYMEMGKYDVAKYYGSQCLEEAYRIRDNVWTMNGRVLLGHIEIKCMDLYRALENFEYAEEAARKWGNLANCKSLGELVFGLGVWIEKVENDELEAADAARDQRHGSDDSYLSWEENRSRKASA